MSRNFVAATLRPIDRMVAVVQADPALLARHNRAENSKVA